TASRVGSMYRTAARPQGAINRAPIHINLRVQMSPAPPQGTRKGHLYHTTKRPTRPVYGRGGLAPTLSESGVNPRQRLKLMCIGCDKSGPYTPWPSPRSSLGSPLATILASSANQTASSFE